MFLIEILKLNLLFKFVRNCCLFKLEEITKNILKIKSVNIKLTFFL